MSQRPNTNLVVVTGAAGYIGGMTCIQLKKHGFQVIAVDERHNLHLDKFYDEFIQDDFIGIDALSLYKKVYPCAIVHCAGTSLVGPSFENPALYFHNNVARTNILLNFITNEIPETKVIFSSSAAVYGEPVGNYCLENNRTDPVSPYGESKLMVEKLLHWYHHSHGLKYVAFRYFNAAGADSNGQHGQERHATHLIAKLFDAALNDTTFTMYGWDYPTPDGTCIRDYIHVADIANAHIKAIDRFVEGIYNLGSFAGMSNLQIQNKIEEITNKQIVTNIEPRRKGDPAKLIADSSKFRSMHGWIPEYDLDSIIKDAHTWYTSETYKSL